MLSGFGRLGNAAGFLYRLPLFGNEGQRFFSTEAEVLLQVAADDGARPAYAAPAMHHGPAAGSGAVFERGQDVGEAVGCGQAGIGDGETPVPDAFGGQAQLGSALTQQVLIGLQWLVGGGEVIIVADAGIQQQVEPVRGVGRPASVMGKRRYRTLSAGRPR